ncbi:MAG: SUMF1/EgtB/PvdO family nonheme iron enzyme [Bacteroidia bacterium]|nr:SUMF1/EgtB/PvdO family nonheme iron enzyme [Bacteroidia bacterium]MDW8235369.1 SUMF1/EgtB/PvdO family nonheme iron enzyme [Bacteroidia bacterium]
MRKSSRIVFAVAAVVGFAVFTGCSRGPNLDDPGKSSRLTGLEYPGQEGGSSTLPGVSFKRFRELDPGPGLVFIEGGTFHMGGTEKDLDFEQNALVRQVSVTSFYMDETEVPNIEYKMFLYYTEKDSGETKAKLLYPDTNVWFREMAYNDPYVRYYFQHEGYHTYPVVGVNWHQAREYAAWRTSIVNKSISEKDPEAILYPDYRLPSEAEWEYAARAGYEQQLYPWEGRSLRDMKGRFRINFKRGRGDYAGRSNKGGSLLVEGLNDAYIIPAPVKAFYPNDYGLYNMAGNVAEWTEDTYRVLSYEDAEDLNTYRRRGQVTDPLQSDDAYDVKESFLYSPRALGETQNPWTNKENAKDADAAKVYRGGSWADIAYYVTCGARRYFHADSSSATIGFRCAMVRVGRPF